MYIIAKCQMKKVQRSVDVCGKFGHAQRTRNVCQHSGSIITVAFEGGGKCPPPLPTHTFCVFVQ